MVRDVSGYLAVLAMCSGAALADNGNGVVVTARSSDDCQVTPVIHVLQYPGCVPKPIPSFACTGRCSSYLQVYVTLKFLMTYPGSAGRFYYYYFFFPVSIRFPGRKYGKWRGLACAVRRAANGKRRYRFFVPKPNRARKSLERYGRTY